jgi:epoxyqueuosine reductase QueG
MKTSEAKTDSVRGEDRVPDTGLTQSVKGYAREEVGFDLVGIAAADDPQFDIAPEGHKPAEWLPGARSVVVGGIKVLREILHTTPSPVYSKHYDQLNVWMTQAAYELSRFLQEKGFRAMYFPETDPYEYFRAQVERGEPRLSPSFCHLHAAVAAGLGRRGKVGVVLTPEYGPRQRWISVITTAPLVPDPRLEKEQCIEFIKPGSCQDKCIEVCQKEQSGALKPWPDEGGVDMFACNWPSLKAGGLSCGRCIEACPVGKVKF